MNNELLVKVGIIAANKWGIDPTKVKIEFVSNPQPFKIQVELIRRVEDPWHPRPPEDIITFEQYSDTHYRLDGDEFILAWGPKTNTLVIYCFRALKRELGRGKTVRV